MTFKDKVVAITGAAGGIGQSLCRLFIDEGAKIAAIDKKASLEGLAAELNADAKRFAHAVADISQPPRGRARIRVADRRVGASRHSRQQCRRLGP